MYPAAEKFIATRRALLDRLELFLTTDSYRRLQAVVDASDADLPDAWLAEWIISPAFGLDGLPIDIVNAPGGVDLLEEHLKRIVHHTGA